MAPRPIASRPHPIAPRISSSFSLSFDTCCVILHYIVAHMLCCAWPPLAPLAALATYSCLLCPTCYKSATEPRFSTQRDHSARMPRQTRLGRPAHSGSGFAPSVASRACGRAPSSKQACLAAGLAVRCTAQVRCYPQQQRPLLSSPRRPAVSSRTAGPEAQRRQPCPWAGGRSIVVGATHPRPQRSRRWVGMASASPVR